MNELIERLAAEAGIWPDGRTRVATIGEMQDQVARFAALVAEQCAQEAQAGCDEAERESGAEAAGALDSAATRIRAKFPMPKP